MGFFGHAYIIEGYANEEGVAFSVSAYSSNGPALFSWGPGVRTGGGMRGFADGTLLCEKQLRLLKGYPRRYQLHHANAPAPGIFQIEESFFPFDRREPVLFHIVLPHRYVLRPDRKPFTLEPTANLMQRNDQLVLTWPTVGGADIRFSIARLRDEDDFKSYDFGRLLTKPEGRSKLSFELNLGIVKVKVG
jgi:hypothetical protein